MALLDKQHNPHPAPQRKIKNAKTNMNPRSDGETGSKPRKKTKSKAVKSAASPKKKAAPKKKTARKKLAKPASVSKMEATATDSTPTQKSVTEDFEALSGYLTNVAGKSQNVIQDFLARQTDPKRPSGEMSADPFNIGGAFQEMMKGLSADPGTVMQRQFSLWGDYARLMTTMSRKMAGEEVEPAIIPKVGDKRFKHAAWDENHMLDFIKQSYLVFGNWLETTVGMLEGMEEHDKKKAEFYTAQVIDAFSPSNFAMLNPDVIDATIETKGENLLKGLKNLLEDIERGDGNLSLRQADLDFFKIGENVATTPGKVVFQNDIFQLIQYEPTTAKVAKRPLLVFPSWINKFYILDLQPGNSFLKWMVEQGRTVFVVSWVNPTSKLASKTFYDYVNEGALEALKAVELATGEREVDAIGYCIGGTMLSTALSLMAQKNDDRVKSATFFTAQADFTESGDLSLFVDDAQLKTIEKQMEAAGGVLEGSAMSTTFNMLRSKELIWSFVIDNYMMGKEPAKFDLLFWNSDATRMPKDVHVYYLREFYQKNRLARGEMKMGGETLDLGKVDIPIFMQAGETDHIAPYRSVYNTAKLFGGDNVRYMLAGSGHIAGVVNHPSKNKYHHSLNDALPGTVEEWQEGATRYPGSWWPHWMEWLNEISPGKVMARTPGDKKLKIIEDAPGSYVKAKA